jgi:hypothetical protein
MQTVCSAKMDMHPQSHNCPTETKEPNFRSGKMWAKVAASGVPGIGRNVLCMYVMKFPSGSLMSITLLTAVILGIGGNVQLLLGL